MAQLAAAVVAPQLSAGHGVEEGVAAVAALDGASAQLPFAAAADGVAFEGGAVLEAACTTNAVGGIFENAARHSVAAYVDRESALYLSVDFGCSFAGYSYHKAARPAARCLALMRYASVDLA